MKKKILLLTTLLLIMFTAISLQSCEDDKIAQTLEGIWEGEVAQTYFDYRWGERTDYEYVDIRFYGDPYKHATGNGVEYDYFDDTYEYSKCAFRYTVRDGVIYIDYEDNTHVAIRNYKLTDNHFTGEFINNRTGDYIASFDFIKVASWRHDRRTRSGEAAYRLVPNPAQKKQADKNK